ncbi:MAG: fibronectin type III domain-containing protein [Thermoflexales bacterium]
MRGAIIAIFAIALGSPGLGSAIAQASPIKSVMVAQVLGNQLDRYVAGKDAAVIVVLNAPEPVNAAIQQVVIKFGGNTLATLEPVPSAEPTAKLVFMCATRAACGDWKAGDYTFDVKIGDAIATATAKFQERKNLDVIMAPVKANYGANDVRTTSGIWKGLIDFSQAIYPVAPDKFKVRVLPEIDASADQFNTLTPEGRIQLLLQTIQGSQQAPCFEDPRPADLRCADSISGFVKNRLGPGADLQGFAVKKVKTNINVESDADASATVAHEIGHLYNLGDEYQGGAFNCPINPPPASYVGKDFGNAETKNFSCKDSKSAEPPAGFTGSLIKADVDYPIEIGGRGLLTDKTSFMGNGPSQDGFWISPANWAAIFDYLDPAKKSVKLDPASSAKGTAPRYATATRWIFAVGAIGKDDKVLLQPWYSFEDTHVHADTTGDVYTLHAVDATGKTLASEALEVEFEALDGKGESNLAIFEGAIPFPGATAKFEILKGTKVLAEVKVSANTPVVKVIAPAAGETLSGKTYTVKWDGSDKDGGKIYYEVDYSDDGVEWITVGSDIEKSEFAVNLSELPGSDKPTAQFRVTASDGVNSSDALSGKFSIAPRAPEVDINYPKPNTTVKAGALVSLKGSAWDSQDEEITGDEALVWSSDIQGELGKGALVNVKNLKPGKHTITLKATNSFKVSGSGTVVITVAEAAPAAPTVAPTAAPTRVPPTVVPPTTAPTAVPVAQAPTAVPPTAVVAPTKAPAAPAAPPPPADNTGLIIGGIVALAAVGGGVFFIMRRKKA